MRHRRLTGSRSLHLRQPRKCQRAIGSGVESGTRSTLSCRDEVRSQPCSRMMLSLRTP